MWIIEPLIFFAIISLGVRAIITNSAVKREIAIKSLVVRTDYNIHFQVTNDEKEYLFILPSYNIKDLSYISFYDLETIEDLQSAKVSDKCPKEFECWRIKFTEGKRSIGVKMANLRQLRAYPEYTRKLEDPFQLKLQIEKYYPSIYKTEKQKTFFK